MNPILNTINNPLKRIAEDEINDSSAKRPRIDSIGYSLGELPVEIVDYVCSFLDGASLVHFQRVSRESHNLVQRKFHQISISLAHSSYLTSAAHEIATVHSLSQIALENLCCALIDIVDEKKDLVPYKEIASHHKVSYFDIYRAKVILRDIQAKNFYDILRNKMVNLNTRFPNQFFSQLSRREIEVNYLSPLLCDVEETVTLEKDFTTFKKRWDEVATKEAKLALIQHWVENKAESDDLEEAKKVFSLFQPESMEFQNFERTYNAILSSLLKQDKLEQTVEFTKKLSDASRIRFLFKLAEKKKTENDREGYTSTINEAFTMINDDVSINSRNKYLMLKDFVKTYMRCASVEEARVRMQETQNKSFKILLLLAISQKSEDCRDELEKVLEISRTLTDSELLSRVGLSLKEACRNIKDEKTSSNILSGFQEKLITLRAEALKPSDPMALDLSESSMDEEDREDMLMTNEIGRLRTLKGVAEGFHYFENQQESLDTFKMLQNVIADFTSQELIEKRLSKNVNLVRLMVECDFSNEALAYVKTLQDPETQVMSLLKMASMIDPRTK